MNPVDDNYRVLVLHTRTADPDEVERVRRTVSAKFPATTKVLLAREDWEARVGATEGWSGWEKEVALGSDLYTSEPHYHGYVILNHVMGKATFEIVDMVLQTTKPVFLLKEEQMWRVQEITYLGTGSFKEWGQVTRMK